jgi:KAP family P-loop domain
MRPTPPSPPKNPAGNSDDERDASTSDEAPGASSGAGPRAVGRANVVSPPDRDQAAPAEPPRQAKGSKHPPRQAKGTRKEPPRDPLRDSGEGSEYSQGVASRGLGRGDAAAQAVEQRVVLGYRRAEAPRGADVAPADDERAAQPLDSATRGPESGIDVGTGVAAPSHDAELTLLLRRAAWIGRSGAPYVSFTSLFLGLFASADATSRWVQSKAPWIGPQLDDIIRRWRIRAPSLQDANSPRVRDASKLKEAELPLQYETSSSASAMLRVARKIAVAVSGGGSLATRHVLAAYVYGLDENTLDVAAWKLEPAAWATRLIAFILDAYPSELDAWRELHEQHYPRPLSQSVRAALRWATLRAGQTQQEIDSALLLEGFLLAGLADEAQSSSAAELVDYVGEGIDALELGELATASELPEEPLPIHSELAPVFARAEVFATATPTPASGAEELHARHVIAALLTDRRPLSAFGLLHRSRRTQGGVLAQFRQWLCRIGPGNDDKARWRELFDEYRDDVLSGYDNDEAHGEDRLDISSDVRALAAVLASTKVTPPLSVGLFGDWGSGKSFFMGKLRERIEQLASAAEAGPDGESWFCGKRGKVVQIDFNAWHYIDADLWSSLAVRVFDKLSEEFQRDFADACREKLTSLAERERALLAERNAAITAAAGLEVLLTQQRAARAEREVHLAELAKRLAVEQLQKIKTQPEVARVTGELKLEGSNIKRELQAAQRDLQYVGGRAELWWRTLGAPARAITLLLVLGIPAATAAIVAAYVNAGGTFVAALATVATTLSGLFVRVRSFAKRVAGPVDAAVSEVLRIEQAVRDVKTPAELEIEAERDGNTARIAELEREQLALAKRRAELEAELAALQQGDAKTLRQFILERAAAQDYRKHLGVISAIHKDFRELAGFLAPGDSGPNVERIVLYIDDLDRCPPKRVVEVLQAIHIILSLPLFVVVVGVDSRWLLDSLSAFYREQFPKDAVPIDVARPQQYLEKIFQVPFTLAPMSEGGFGALVGGMLGRGEEAWDGPLVSGATGDDATAPRRPAESAGGAPRAPRSPSAREPRRTPPERIDLMPRSLQLEPEELVHLQSLGRLVPTPRSAKRLVNLYRIVRASLDDDALTELLAGRYRLTQLCLALVIGNPAFGAELFRQILSGKLGSRAELSDWLTARSRSGDDVEARVVSALQVLSHRNAEFAEWSAVEATARRVGRFSFETGRTLGLRASRLHDRGGASSE